MKTPHYFVFLAVIITACHLPANADKKYSESANNQYKLQLRPLDNSSYHYDVTNTTETQVEINGNKAENSNQSTAGITYNIKKDSSGNYLFSMKYDQLRMSLKNGESETELDAANGKLSLNPTERMLAILKDANLTATITPTGEVKQIDGYRDLSIQLLSMLDQNDLNAKQIAQKQLDKLIGGEMIKNTMNQLFKMFPDSAVRVGDKWKINSKQEGQLSFNTATTFRLKDITNEIAHLTSESEIESDNSPMDLNGYNVIADFKGTQEGRFEVETKTGMLLNSEAVSEIKGSLKMDQNEFPVSIKIKVKIEGKKLK
jgi:hypothetical protein